MASNQPLNGRPVIYGEVLFDCFEDGNDVLGGAPFNVAWHLQGFGLEPLFISRVGNDQRGEAVVAAMNDWGMDVTGVQTDAHHPTGVVQVTLRDGQPAFSIVPDQAYDYIDAGLATEVVKKGVGALLYCGSLIARCPTSRNTLQALRNESALPVFVDINLRSPWWDQPLIWQSLRGARWAKLNEHEIRIALELPDSEDQPVVELAAALRQRYQLEVLIATMGEKGACFVHNEGTQCGEPVPVKTFVDAVGAGDAFSAVTILGLCSGWSYKDIQQRALTFASRICENRGATTRNRALYQELLQQWQT